jgi:hypothetical protein
MKAKWTSQEFNNTGSQFYNADSENCLVLAVIFRNQGTATVKIRVGSQSGVENILQPRESVTFSMPSGIEDTTVYYISFGPTGTRSCIANICKTIQQ